MSDERQQTDVHAALVLGINFLRSHPKVDANRIGGLGVGGGAGYMAHAAVALGPEAVRALGLVAGPLSGLGFDSDSMPWPRSVCPYADRTER